jgi:glycosyltransferase involved in cell wall biosynthesis
MNLGEFSRAVCRPGFDVTFVVPQLTPLMGMERAAVEAIRALASTQRVQVVVLFGEPAAELADEQVEVRYLNLPRRPYRMALAARSLSRMGSDFAGVVVGVGMWGALPALAGVRDKRIVVWEHSLLPARRKHDRKVRMLMPFIKALYPRAAAIAAVSDAVEEYLRQLFPETSVVVIPNVIPVAAQPTRVSRGRATTLLYMGSLTRVKNVGLAIRALEHLPHDVTLDVAGTGPELERLQSAAREAGVTNRVRFRGHVNDVRPLLERAAVLVHPSVAETFGFALIEAAEHHVPVAALNVPNVNRVVPNYAPGVLVDAATPESFAAAIETTLVKDWHSAAFDRAAIARREAFGVEAIAGQWGHLLSVAA